MPTFSSIQLKTSLEPRPRISNLKQQQQQQIHHDSSINNQQNQADEEDALKITKRRSPKHVFISPALYTTPQPTPILDSDSCLSGSVSPSPYVFNRKGRGGGGSGGGARVASPSLSRPVNGFEIHEEQEEMHQQKICDSDEIGVVDDNFGDEKCDVEEDFYDPRADSASSVADSVDMNDFGRDVNSLSLVSNQGDFYDADEEFFSDGSVSSVKTCGRSIESELRATRLRLFEEIEKRKTAEDAFAMIQGLWQRFSSVLLYQTGFTFPITSSNADEQFDISSLEQFSQEVIVARFVSEAIGNAEARAEARAEAELAAEVIIESKDQEISRLKDRLQYYEAMNHEMSQRNIEVMEVARRQRVRRRGQRKWLLWSCLGISVVIGASVIAYSFLPQTSEELPPMLPASSNDTDSSCSITSSESSY